MTSLTWAVVLLAGLACVQGSGTPTAIENYPSTVQMENKVATVWLQQCVASLITNFHCVTAASCTQDLSSNRRILLGTNTRGDNSTVREVATISNHPEYNAATGFADISVIRMNATVLFGPTIYPIMILPQDFEMGVNWLMSTVGWGITTEGGAVSNNNLYRLDLTTKALDACQAAHPGRVTSNNICAGLPTTTGRDFDGRDTGAPLIYENILVAVLIHGNIRRDDTQPIVGTSTGAFSNWIVSQAV